MEIFGGFMVMLSLIGFFLTVIWFVMPFVVFSIKGRVDRAIDQLESIERRIAAIEAALAAPKPSAFAESKPLGQQMEESDPMSPT